jgi:hypothetical protein
MLLKILLFAKNKPFLFFIISVPIFFLSTLFVTIFIIAFSENIFNHFPNIVKDRTVVSAVLFIPVSPIFFLSILLIFETQVFLVYNFFAFFLKMPKLARIMLLNIDILIDRKLLNRLIKWRKL